MGLRSSLAKHLRQDATSHNQSHLISHDARQALACLMSIVTVPNSLDATSWADSVNVLATETQHEQNKLSYENECHMDYA
jgi:hypothetical protein